MGFIVHFTLRSKYLFLAALFVGLNFHVAAKTNEERRIEFVKSFESIRSKVSDAFENKIRQAFVLF